LSFDPDHLAQWGSWASLVGVGLSLLGFGATLRTVYRTRRAAEAASETARRTLSRLRSIDVIYGVADIMGQLEHILELQRAGQYGTLQDRYARVRRQMIALRTSDRLPSEEALHVINQAIAFCADGERAIGRRLVGIDVPDAEDTGIHDLGERLSDIVDEMYRVGAALKSDAERDVLDDRDRSDA